LAILINALTSLIKYNTMNKKYTGNQPIKTPHFQRGASLVEFVIVAPIITLMGMGMLQYALLFNAKNHLNHAAFMAARSGATHHALLEDTTAPGASIMGAYIHALAPLYGGGSNPSQVAQSALEAKKDMAGNLQIEIISPTKESFTDWSDAQLSATLGQGRGPNGSNALVIRNSGQAYADRKVGEKSGQTIQEANLLKIRVTHGYQPSVPAIRRFLMLFYQKVYPESELSEFEKMLLKKGRIPVVSQATVQMQSHPILQAAMVSVKDKPDGENGGGSSNPPGNGGGSGAGGNCSTLSCEGTVDPSPGEGDGNGPGCITEDRIYEASDASGLVYFEFDSSELTDEAKADLDDYMDESKDQLFDSIDIYGFTDRQGDEDYNMALSKKRAEAVEKYFKDNGFTKKTIKVIAKGETSPKESCPGADADPAVQKCLAGNRRVVIKLNNIPIGAAASQDADAASSDPAVSP
jgi:outer membrane protein OmpA-like peptidoglycan-associated protein